MPRCRPAKSPGRRPPAAERFASDRSVSGSHSKRQERQLTRHRLLSRLLLLGVDGGTNEATGQCTAPVPGQGDTPGQPTGELHDRVVHPHHRHRSSRRQDCAGKVSPPPSAFAPGPSLPFPSLQSPPSPTFPLQEVAMTARSLRPSPVHLVLLGLFLSSSGLVANTPPPPSTPDPSTSFRGATRSGSRTSPPGRPIWSSASRAPSSRGWSCATTCDWS